VSIVERPSNRIILNTFLVLFDVVFGMTKVVTIFRNGILNYMFNNIDLLLLHFIIIYLLYHRGCLTVTDSYPIL